MSQDTDCPKCGKPTERLRSVKKTQLRRCVCGFEDTGTWYFEWRNRYKPTTIKQQAKDNPEYQQFKQDYLTAAAAVLPRGHRGQMLDYEYWLDPAKRVNHQKVIDEYRRQLGTLTRPK